MTRHVAIYCRISQDRTGAGLGVERQEQDCRALAVSLGWTVVAVYVDNDVSAYSGKPRPGYRALLAALQAGEADAVIVWHPDRLHRSPVELEAYIAVVDPGGIPTATVRAGELDLSTASGRMTARIVGSVARAESERASEKLRRQRRQAREQGRPHGGRRPFGYLTGGMVAEPVEAALVVDAAQRILAGSSVRAVFRAWNTAGITTTAGQPWDGSNLRAMLLRPRNAGLMAHQRQVIGPAAWPAILDRDVWEALVALLNDPARLTHRGTSRKLLGSFLYLCECGGLLRSGGSRYGEPRYTCAEFHLRRASRRVDELVLNTVARVLVRDGLTLLAPAVDLTPLRRRRDMLRAHSEEIASMFGDPASGMTAEQFRVSNTRLQAELSDVEASLAQHSAGSPLAGIADADDPEAAFRGLDDVDRQRRVIDALVTVTLLRQRPGRLPGGLLFDPLSVRVEPRRASRSAHRV